MCIYIYILCSILVFAGVHIVLTVDVTEPALCLCLYSAGISRRMYIHVYTCMCISVNSILF